jgi:hypothetical protein
MTNRNKISRITLAGSLHGLVCTRNRASHLLQGLRKDYQLLTPEERNQVECFLLASIQTTVAAVQAPTCSNRKWSIDRAVSEEESHGRW